MEEPVVLNRWETGRLASRLDWTKEEPLKDGLCVYLFKHVHDMESESSINIFEQTCKTVVRDALDLHDSH